MKVLLVGAGGQVGRSLQSIVPAEVELLAVAHAELDISDAAQVSAFLSSAQPAVVINAAAYTAVDRAETEPERARAVNEIGPGNLARGAASIGAKLVHLSTDFVFDGESSTPYVPDSRPGPLNVYGQTKLEGERQVLAALAGNSLIVRTSWVYSSVGQNFMRTMLRLMKERGSVRVVADQIGVPTSAQSVAEALWRLLHREASAGIYHWNDAGVATWYDFALAIAEEAAVLGLLPPDIQVTPIASEDYASPARRPRFSVLDKRSTMMATGIAPSHWRQNLRKVLREVALLQPATT